MRVTNQMITNNSLRHMQTSTRRLDNLTEQLTSGQKIQRASEDPVVAVRALKLRNTVNQLYQYKEKNIKDADSWIELTENSITNVSNYMEYMVGYCNQGATDSFNNNDRNAIAETIRAYKDMIYSEGNATYAGRYIFSGYKTSTAMTFTATEAPRYSYQITEELDMWINLQDPMELLELADEVIIGRVKSVDGCSNYNEWKQTYDSDGIYTFGTIEVLQSVKGDLKEGQVIDYLKMGGIIGKEEYLKGVSDSVKNKKDFDPAKMKPFVSSYYADDVRIENGKEYLIYLGNDFEKYMANRYAIFYLGGGLREVNLEEGSILNNFTGAWEDLDSLLSKMSMK